VGQTDSELAFCHILERLWQEFPQGYPGSKPIYHLLEQVAGEIASFGSFNFLLSNGECLFAHCSTHLHFLVRKAPFGDAHLIDQDITVDFSQVAGANDKVAVIASFPLTDNEIWSPLHPGQLLMFQDGEPVF